MRIFFFLVSLVVGVIGLPPVIIKHPGASEILFKISLTGDKHRSFEIPCEASGDPPPKYRWVKNGKDFDLNVHADRIIQKPHSGSITFAKPNKDDVGEYFCLAENNVGTAKSNPVMLQRAFLDNFENNSVETIIAQEGDSLKLACKVPKGYPKPGIFWMIQTNQGAIKSVENPRVTLDPTGNLWFSPLTMDDASADSSFYVCSAASSVMNEYKLGNRIILKIIPRATKSLLGSPPTPLYVSSPDLLVLRGKKVEMFCIYDGTPVPKISWNRNERIVEVNERVILENYGKSLMIKNVDTDDEGNYSCNVASEIGEKQTSNFKLRVEYPPHFSVEPQSKNITKMETIEIKCSASGVPDPEIRWFHNGNLIEGRKNSRIETRKTILVIKDVEKNDMGNYACYAQNIHGYISRDIYINVQI